MSSAKSIEGLGGLSVCIPSNASRHSAELRPFPVAAFDGVLLKRHRGVKGIDVARSALQEQTQGLAPKSTFYGFDHGGGIIRRVLPVIAPKHHRVASIVHHDGERVAVQRIDA